MLKMESNPLINGEKCCCRIQLRVCVCAAVLRVFLCTLEGKSSSSSFATGVWKLLWPAAGLDLNCFHAAADSVYKLAA